MHKSVATLLFIIVAEKNLKQWEMTKEDNENKDGNMNE